MKDLSVCYEIARLIAAEMAETISPEQQAKLDAWLKEDERHVAGYKRIRARLEKDGSNNIFRDPAIIYEDLDKVKVKLRPDGSRFIKKRFPLYAAIAILLIGVAVSILQKQTKEKNTELAVQQDSILSGSPKAILTLSDGKQVSLENMTDDTLQRNGMILRKRGGELSYEKTMTTDQPGKILFNNITIPRSGEYKLILADGTQVWLNSDSELKYPVRFTDGERRVFLRGEAYFEVAADSEHPFIVETADVNVKVLGTGFNVMAYPGETESAVTLAHGKVGVQTAKQQVILQPDEQYVYHSDSQQGMIRKVNVAYYIDWKEGILNFDAMPLGDLTARLSRWYDVDFFFTSEKLKQLKFSGAFKKYNEIRYVLNIIEEITDVKFVIKGRAITVTGK